MCFRPPLFHAVECGVMGRLGESCEFNLEDQTKKCQSDVGIPCQSGSLRGKDADTAWRIDRLLAAI
jgi:hypothetical protein